VRVVCTTVAVLAAVAYCVVFLVPGVLDWISRRGFTVPLTRTLIKSRFVCIAAYMGMLRPATGVSLLPSEDCFDPAEPNSLNEYFYDWLVNRDKYLEDWPEEFTPDTDSDGRLELSDAWGNPLAIVWGKLGVGSVYHLRDGTVARLLSAEITMEQPVKEEDEGPPWDVMGPDGKKQSEEPCPPSVSALTCMWQLNGQRVTYRYEGGDVSSIGLEGKPLVVFSIRGGKNAPKDFPLRLD